jgi:imidazoleglycerol phosphate synthase glutamine amidotransferase subunit HisH
MSKKNKHKHKRKMSYNHMPLRGRKIYVVGGAVNYASWLWEMEQVTNVADADLVMFTGGADVDPVLYGEKTGAYTGSNRVRDQQETTVFEEAKRLGKKMIGICRGSQFLCVMAGGKLVQHCTHHAIGGVHEINWAKGSPSFITSTHHQMQYPFNMDKKDYYMCAYSTKKKSDVYLNGDNEPIDLPKEFVEPEVVVYKNIDAIAIQGHPEHLDRVHPGVIRMKTVVEEFFLADFKIIETQEVYD